MKATAALCVLGLGLAGCRHAPVPVVIDTDMGGDDMMAILYLLRRPDVSVKAIAVTGTGLARCDPGVRIAHALLAVAEHPAIPIACGRQTPLAGTHAFPTDWRDGADAASGVTLPAVTVPPATQTAVELITSAVQGSADKVTLLALGPLTNVAEALQAQPSLVQRLANVQVMGGAVDAPGNVGPSGVGIANDFAEWNIYVDPTAAEVVIRNAPVTLVALDATQHAPITRGFLSRIEADHPAPEADLVYRLLAAQGGFIDSGQYFFWDPLAAASMVDKSMVTLQMRNVKVITQEGAESGRTQAAADGTSVQVAVGANATAFETALLETLNRRIK